MNSKIKYFKSKVSDIVYAANTESSFICYNFGDSTIRGIYGFEYNYWHFKNTSDSTALEFLNSIAGKINGEEGEQWGEISEICRAAREDAATVN